MTETIKALDNEFAVATGDNVGRDGYSYMDGDPSTNSNLVVTSNDGDDNPYVFDVGDTYDISFETVRGLSTVLDDAVVIGSDYIPDYDSWWVTFKGADAEGNSVQVVWTPGFDLDRWRELAVENGYKPAFTDYDEDKETTYAVKCFTAETLIATDRGPVPIGAVGVGDLVQTRDAGFQPVCWVGQQVVAGSGALAPILFERGTIGNNALLRLSPQHRVLHASSRAQLLFGDHEVLVPAKSMVNGRSIRRAPVKAVTYFHLLFEGHHIIQANGAACESLFLGNMSEKAPGIEGTVETYEVFGATLPPKIHARAARRLLTCRESAALFGACIPASALVLNRMAPIKRVA